MSKPDQFFLATKALVVHDGRVLLIRESNQYRDGTNAGKYDVPGGRLEPGKNVVDSLRREVKEETGLDVTVGQPFFISEWFPAVRGEQWQVVGVYFVCMAGSDQVTLSQDHDDFKWIGAADYQGVTLIDGLAKVFAAYINR